MECKEIWEFVTTWSISMRITRVLLLLLFLLLRCKAVKFSDIHILIIPTYNIVRHKEMQQTTYKKIVNHTSQMIHTLTVTIPPQKIPPPYKAPENTTTSSFPATSTHSKYITPRTMTAPTAENWAGNWAACLVPWLAAQKGEYLAS